MTILLALLFLPSPRASAMTKPEFIAMVRDEGSFARAARAGEWDLIQDAYRVSPEMKELACAKDDAGHTPLFYAAIQGNLKMMSFLEEHGACLDAAIAERTVPVRATSVRPNRWLGIPVDGGTFVGIADDFARIVPDVDLEVDGMTLIEAFARLCNVDGVELLLAHGAKLPRSRYRPCSFRGAGVESYSKDQVGLMLASIKHPRKPFSEALRRFRPDGLSDKQKDLLAKGELQWRAPGELYAIPVVGYGAWERFSLVAKRWLEADIAAFTGPRPAPESLLQGRYESREDFERRVEAARRKRDADLEAFNDKLRGYPEWRRGAVLEAALSVVLGEPRVTRTSFDREAQVFSATVAGDSPYARDFSQTFRLEQPVKARQDAFEAGLAKARPRIFFRRDGADVSIAYAEFDVEGKAYRALPGEGADKPQAVARVEAGSPAPVDDKLSVRYGEPRVGSAVRTSDVDQAPARAAARRPHDFALIVGVESYKDSELPRAAYAERDADAVALNLEALGVPKENILTLKGSDATSAVLKGYLDSYLAKNVSADSRVYFYFSGHGAPDPETRRAYLVPWDSNPKFLKETGLPLSEVYASLAKLKAKEVLVATDACFTGSGERSIGVAGARPLVTVQDDLPPGGVTCLAAAGGDQIARSLDDEGHGAFTYYFLKGLRDGLADTNALCGYLADNVKAAAARQNGVQTPVCKGPDFAFK